MTDPNGPVFELTEIVVTGRRIRYEYQRPAWIEPPVNVDPGGDAVKLPGEGPAEGPRCLPTAGMSDAEKLQALLRFAAAVALSEIKAQPNQNREYGVLFYEAEGGSLFATAILQTNISQAIIDWDGLPNDQFGNNNYTRIRGFLHSHPCTNLDDSGSTEVSYFVPGDPSRLLRPSPTRQIGPNLAGDWMTYDNIRNNSQSQGVVLNDLVMFIAGCNGTALQLNEYSLADHGYTSNPNSTVHVGSDGLAGARGSMSTRPLPPCSD